MFQPEASLAGFFESHADAGDEFCARTRTAGGPVVRANTRC
jgi:hypothetical protein